MYKKGDIVRATEDGHAPRNEENLLEIVGVPEEDYPENVSGGGWDYPDEYSDRGSLYDAADPNDKEYLLRTRSGKCRVFVGYLFEHHPEHLKMSLLKMKEELGV